MANIFEDHARLQKALKLARVLRAHEATSEMVLALDDKGWHSVAKEAKCNPPSTRATIEQVARLMAEEVIGERGHCLYCGVLTASHIDEQTPPTVCRKCAYDAPRDERQEVAAGVFNGRPWARPLNVPTNCKPMPDGEAAELQAAYDRRQTEITAKNREADRRAEAKYRAAGWLK